MKLFIDSADINEIRQAYSWGICDGVTTNPSLLKKAVDKGLGKDLKGYITEICKVAKGTPVSLEVTEFSSKGMIEQGKRLYKMFNPAAGNVYIKVPVNPTFEDNPDKDFEGILAIRELSRAKIPVNCTLVFTPEQALLAAKAGAKFVSPFAGRIDDDLRKNAKMKYDKTDYYPAEGMEAKKGKGLLEDNGIVSGVDLVGQCVGLLKGYGLPCEVLAASLRNTRQVRECALVGADIATIPYGVIKQLLVHHKTSEGMKAFTKDIVPEYVKMIR